MHALLQQLLRQGLPAAAHAECPQRQAQAPQELLALLVPSLVACRRPWLVCMRVSFQAAAVACCPPRALHLLLSRQPVVLGVVRALVEAPRRGVAVVQDALVWQAEALPLAAVLPSGVAPPSDVAAQSGGVVRAEALRLAEVSGRVEAYRGMRCLHSPGRWAKASRVLFFAGVMRLRPQQRGCPPKSG